MIILIYTCFTFVFLVDWLVGVIGVGNRYFSLVPEFISVLIMAYIPICMGLNKRFVMPNKYFLWIIIYVGHLAISIAVNDMDLGPILSGLRVYLKFVPFFILPFVLEISEKDVGRILKLLLTLTLLQCPVAIWQRFVGFADVVSGDPVGGTLGTNTSGTLSVILIITIGFIVSMYLRSIINLSTFIIFTLLAFIPTTLNETKITLILLPIGLLLPVIVNLKNMGKIGKNLNVVMVSLFALILFVSIYNSLAESNIADFYSNNESMVYAESRLYQIRSAFTNVGRQELITFIFGYGPGNVSSSQIEGLEGGKYYLFKMYMPDSLSVSRIVWEIGYGGIIILVVFINLIFFDSLRIAKKRCSSSFFSLGMMTFSILFLLSMFYGKSLESSLMMYSYFFMSSLLHVSSFDNLNNYYDSKQ